MSKISTRTAYGEALAAIGGDERIIVLDADLQCCTRTEKFAALYPERSRNVGIAEANMVGMAAGLAACGKIVFVNSFAMFTAGRAFEQIRNSLAYPHLNVKVIGTHAGVTVGKDGATHQCLEDIAAMRAIPGMMVLSPCDANETRLVTKAIAEYDGPCFMRLGRLDVEVLVLLLALRLASVSWLALAPALALLLASWLASAPALALLLALRLALASVLGSLLGSASAPALVLLLALRLALASWLGLLSESAVLHPPKALAIYSCRFSNGSASMSVNPYSSPSRIYIPSPDYIGFAPR